MKSASSDDFDSGPLRVAEVKRSPAAFPVPRGRFLQVAQIALVVGLGLIVRLLLVQAPGYHDDIVIFSDWFKGIAVLPPAQVYPGVPSLNYPPVAVIVYELEALFVRLFWHGALTEYVLNIVIKLPAILADVLGSLLVYRIVRRHASHAVALLGCAAIALNPTVIYLSAYWGQDDSIPALLALFAIAELVYGNAVVAWLAIAAAIMFKPPVLVLVPLMCLYPFTARDAVRWGRLRWGAIGIASALILVEILALVYFPQPNPFIAARHLLAKIVQGSSYFPYTSLNSFNFWALLGPFFASDHTRFLFMSRHRWGDLMFTTSAAVIYWRYVRSRDPVAMLEAATLVLLAFFLLLTEMHERYLLYALVFCVPLLFKQSYRIAALVLSVTLLLNLEYGLTFMYLDDAKATVIDRYEFAPWLIHLGTLANIGVFIVLLRDFLGARIARLRFGS
jgi:dolichyl-phosphate-mannose-protein mannosyltransferase